MAPIDLYLLTFNCGRSLVDPATLGPRLLDAYPAPAGLPDIVAISLQEISPIAYAFLGGSYLDPYYARVADALRVASVDRGGHAQTYLNVLTKNTGMTALMLFARADVAPQIHGLHSAVVGVGLWDMGNKGAVGVHFSYPDHSGDRYLDFTIIAAHLAPSEIGLKRRNRDWENIVRNLVFVPERSALPPGPSAAYYDHPSQESEPLLPQDPDRSSKSFSELYRDGSYVFFAGDLNYRTSDSPPDSKSYLSYPQPTDATTSPRHFAHLLRNDQLNRERSAGRTLHGFRELPITFPPTYKYSSKRLVTQPTQVEPTGSSQNEQAAVGTWHWAKYRFPSWCDRILFLPPLPGLPDLVTHRYVSLPIQPTSDHQPVALSVSLSSEAAPAKPTPDRVRQEPPFPANQEWRARLAAARRKEIVVGVMAYLTLTREGLVISIGSALFAVAVWHLLGS